MLDFLLVNGLYPDYEKNEMVNGNIGISKGKIAYIGCEKPEAATVIDCSGRVVSPGFIDIHMHEEYEEEGDKWVIADMMLKQGVTTAVGGNCGDLLTPVKMLKEKISRMGGCPINYIMLSGYNHYRRNVLGIGEHESCGKDIWDKIREYMLADLEEGAFGVSFGIEYDPGITTEEVKYGCQLKDDDRLLISAHYRWDSKKAIPAIREMIEIQNSMTKKFQISHLSSCSAYGQMKEALEIINDAMEKNPRLSYDTYPYNAFSTDIGTTVFEDGFLETLDIDYSDILLTSAPYENVRCTKEIFEDARKNYPDMLAVTFAMKEEEIAGAIANKYGMVASDGIVWSGLGHPRAAGTFPRLLGKYVREDKTLSLIDALRKITMEPARRLELQDKKGVIKTGADADLTVFDPMTIIDGPKFSDITIPNKGIDYVIINGELALQDNVVQNGLAGRFISFKEL